MLRNPAAQIGSGRSSWYRGLLQPEAPSGPTTITRRLCADAARVFSITRPSESCAAVVSFGLENSGVSGTAISPHFHVFP